MQSEASVIIDRPIEDVFRFTLDHVPEWSNIVVADEVVEDMNDGGAGTKFHVVTEENGQRMYFDGIVTRHDPPRLRVIEMKGKSFDIEVEYRFEEIAGQTQVTQSSNVEGKGLFKVLLVLAGWMMKKASCKAAERELENLKAFCEGHTG